MNLSEFANLLDLLQRKGVSEYEGPCPGVGTCKLKLGKSNEVIEPTPERSKADILREAAKQLAAPAAPKRGNDGLTADEQEELYGQPLDEFPSEEG